MTATKADIEQRLTNETRAASGNVDTSDPMVVFLYVLMRDKLPAGTVAAFVKDVAINFEQAPVTVLTNGWLAEYAKHLAGRLK